MDKKPDISQFGSPILQCMTRQNILILFNLQPTYYFQNQLDYHSSAILASAIDTFSLGYRSRLDCDSIANLCTRMTPLGRRAVSASIQLPLGFESKSNLLDFLENVKIPLWQSISPQCTTEMSVAQTIVLRGITRNMLYSKLVFLMY